MNGARRPGPGDRLHVALVGCGRWGRHILRDLVELGCAVVVADASAAARHAATAAGAESAVGDAAELPAVAGMVVATPTRTHAALLEALLPRRLPIFCDKPLTTDGASAARLAQRAGGRLFVMDKWRYHPGVERLRDLARSGELGPVCGLRTTRRGWANPHSDVDAVWILAPHDLSIALEILGRLPVPRAAVGEQRDGRAVGLHGVLGDDPWVALDVSVALPAIEYTAWSSLKSSEQARREVRLHCRDGVAVLPDAYSDHLEIARPGAPLERRAVSTELPLRRELQAFLDPLAGGPAPKSDAADGAAIVQTLERLRALAGIDANEVCA